MLAVPEIGGWQTNGYFYHCGNAASHSDFAGEHRRFVAFVMARLVPSSPAKSGRSRICYSADFVAH
jgi:hypothetical protein